MRERRCVNAIVVSSRYIFSLNLHSLLDLLLVGSLCCLILDCFRFSLSLFLLSFSPRLLLISPRTAMRLSTKMCFMVECDKACRYLHSFALLLRLPPFLLAFYLSRLISRRAWRGRKHLIYLQGLQYDHNICPPLLAFLIDVKTECTQPDIWPPSPPAPTHSWPRHESAARFARSRRCPPAASTPAAPNP